jgi:2-oxoisovalerate dehydrogenase E1 component
MVATINATRATRMAQRAHRCLRPDVADVSRDAALGKVSGKGGVFKVTHGLQSCWQRARLQFASRRANIISRAVGMAMRGLKPVVGSVLRHIWPACMQLRMRWP